jgi:hypothetical protein
VKQRVLAVAGAVILVASAVLVRSWLVGDGDDSGGGGTRSTGAPPTVGCTADLAELCRALAAADRIAADPPTLELDDLQAPPDDLDGWIGWDPGPRVVDFATGTARWGEGEPLATAPLAVLADPNALAEVCPDAVTWACVADSAGDGLAVGIGDPNTSEGLARIAPFLGPEGPWPTDDFDELAERTAELRDTPPGPQDDAASMADRLVTQPGSLDLVVLTQREAQARAATAQGRSRGLVAVTPTPQRPATVVLAGAPGGAELDAAELCEAAPEAWQAAGLTPCRGSIMADDLAGLLFQVHDRLG